MRNLPAEAVAGINRALTSVPADSIDQLVVEIAGAPRHVLQRRRSLLPDDQVAGHGA